MSFEYTIDRQKSLLFITLPMRSLYSHVSAPVDSLLRPQNHSSPPHHQTMKAVATTATMLAAAGSAAAVTIAEINGNRFISPLRGQNLTGIQGLVTAKGKDGFYLSSAAADDDGDPATSEGIYVYGKAAVGSVQVGDLVSLDARVDEYRTDEAHGFLTELAAPRNIKVASSGNEVRPLVIGADTSAPPNSAFSSLDGGDVWGVPNAESRVSVANPELQPDDYGLDFWESLVGQLVTVRGAYQVSRPNQYGDVWIRGGQGEEGGWNSTGLNARGGLTMLDGDSNPEAIVVGAPLDGTANPDDSRMGDFIGDVTGVVTNAFGFYRILPLTKLTVESSTPADHPPASFRGNGSCAGITVANYNGRNLSPDTAALPRIADQIVDKMLTPDLVFMQEIQDGSGDADDGVVSANATLAALTALVEERSGVVYDYAEVSPNNNQDGGAPGGNIRQAYLYRPDVLELWEPSQGGADDANEVLEGPKLKFNPGRIEPANEAWVDSRKPLAAAWKPVGGAAADTQPFFTVNVHFTSKGGSSTIHGDPRTPVNMGVEKRVTQAEIVAVSNDLVSGTGKRKRKGGIKRRAFTDKKP